MYLKTYVLLLLLGLSVALPQEAVIKAEAQKPSDPKVDPLQEPEVEEPLKGAEEEPLTGAEEEPLTGAEGEPLPDEEIPQDEVVEEEDPLVEGKEVLAEEEEFVEGEEIPEGETVPEEEVEYTCEYTDSNQTALTITFIKDDKGVEQVLEIDPVETENADEKLKECLQQDLVGRRNIKRRRRRRPGKRRPGKRRGVKIRRGGKRRGGASALILRELRRKIRGNPQSVSIGEMQGAIRLAQRYVSARTKEARRRRILRKKGKGNKRRRNTIKKA